MQCSDLVHMSNKNRVVACDEERDSLIARALETPHEIENCFSAFPLLLRSKREIARLPKTKRKSQKDSVNVYVRFIRPKMKLLFSRHYGDQKFEFRYSSVSCSSSLFPFFPPLRYHIDRRARKKKKKHQKCTKNSNDLKFFFSCARRKRAKFINEIFSCLATVEAGQVQNEKNKRLFLLRSEDDLVERERKQK